MRTHPDKGGDKAEFQLLQEAFETLNDTNLAPVYREAYRFHRGV